MLSEFWLKKKTSNRLIWKWSCSAGSVQGDVFIGFHPDATASIILTAWEDLENGDSEPDMDRVWL